MIAMQCAACGKSVTVEESLGSGQPCPVCGQPVGALPIGPRAESTALNDLQEGGKPIRFGAYSAAAEAAWDDPAEPHVEEQVASLIQNEAIVDNAVLNAVPPEVEARFKARRREARRKVIGIGAAALIAAAAFLWFVLS
ncbi:MAG: hypothetical protein KF886_00935 [Candidatus Hydrogenedentes bacterium]|nr:hypothetical protein [Candidatus Hydrogenedentota bacterium]